MIANGSVFHDRSHDLLPVSIADDFRDLSEYVQALVNRQGVAFVSKEVVQRKGIWIAPKKQDRTLFALRRTLREGSLSHRTLIRPNRNFFLLRTALP
jgi:hypothetical protein